ncbi:MAG: transporter substrate-binding domain-containing protein [Myxococcales bacterium]|nr:transporter substrate-binding domain-containing protein [Myxococcales bacterium]
MIKRRLHPILVLLALMLVALSASAEPAGASPERTLVVGVKVAPPFVIQEGDRYRGLAIDLWEEVAQDHGWKYSYKAYDLEGLLGAVEQQQVDVGLGAITATAERERRMDFAHPITSSGLGVAARKEEGAGWLAVAQALVSPAFLKVIGALCLLLLTVGLLAWLFERKRNPENFGGSHRQGIFAGFWWAMVTMTTVGYGDVTPRTVPGRLLAMVWMLTALIVISFFTASITSALTVGKLSNSIQSADDLGRVRVASIDGSTSGQWLKSNENEYTSVDSLDAGLKDLAAGRVDAVVYDAPLLRWQIKRDYQGRLHVLPIQLERQDYAFALPSGSPLREAINTSLLERINAADWDKRLKKYFGSN